MHKATRAGWCLALVPALLCLPGCGGLDVDLAPVKGSITLNGKPLQNAQVEFQPDKGSPSYGTTDENGNFELKFDAEEMGAVIGRHTVRITTRRSWTDPEGKEHVEREILPPKYNLKSEIVKEVTDGRNIITIDLEVPSLKNAKD